MTHTHSHEDASGYYLDQICSVAACGALGGVAVMMWYRGTLEYILNENFILPVVIGGVALFILALIRAVTLWHEAGQAHECCHGEHEHGADGNAHHAHDHGHAHGGHAHHDHDHDHSWTPAKYAVLLLPIVLFLLDLPNKNFREILAGRAIDASELEDPAGPVKAKGGKELELGFKELANAAYFPDRRTFFEGQTGKLVGQFLPMREKEFTLVRIRIICCAADADTVGVRIIAPDPVTQFKPMDWVEVTGLIQFRKVAGREKYIPVLVLSAADQVKPTDRRPVDFDS